MVTEAKAAAGRMTESFRSSAPKIDTSGVVDGMKKVQNEVEKTAQAAQQAGGRLSGALQGAFSVFTGGLALAGISALKTGLSDLFETGKKQKEIFEGLSASVQASGVAEDKVEKTVNNISKGAGELSKRFAISGDAIRNATETYLRFGGTTDNINEKQKIMVGLAEKMRKPGQDMNLAFDAAARALTKATDPEIEAQLTKVGIKFDKNATDADKFRIIQEKIGGTLEGLESKAEGPLGKIFKINDTMAKIGKTVGLALVDGIAPVLGVVADGIGAVIPPIIGAIKSIASEVQTVMGDIGAAIADAFGGFDAGGEKVDVAQVALNALSAVVRSLVAVIKFAGDLVIGTIATVKTLAPVILIAAAAWGAYAIVTNLSAIGTGIATAAQWLLNAAMNANPIGAIVVAIVAAIAAYKLFSAAIGDSAQKQLDNNEAQKKSLKSQIEENEAQQKGVEKTKSLADHYKELAEKKNRSAAESKELQKTEAKLQDQYPGLIKATTDYSQNLDAVATIGKDATDQLAKLKEQNDALQKSLKEATQLTAYIKVNQELEKLRDNLAQTSAFSKEGFGIRSVQEMAAALHSTVPEIIADIDKTRTTFEQGIFNAKTEQQVNDALNGALSAVKRFNVNADTAAIVSSINQILISAARAKQSAINSLSDQDEKENNDKAEKDKKQKVKHITDDTEFINKLRKELHKFETEEQVRAENDLRQKELLASEERRKQDREDATHELEAFKRKKEEELKAIDEARAKGDAVDEQAVAEKRKNIVLAEQLTAEKLEAIQRSSREREIDINDKYDKKEIETRLKATSDLLKIQAEHIKATSEDAAQEKFNLLKFSLDQERQIELNKVVGTSTEANLERLKIEEKYNSLFKANERDRQTAISDIRIASITDNAEREYETKKALAEQALQKELDDAKGNALKVAEARYKFETAATDALTEYKTRKASSLAEAELIRTIADAQKKYNEELRYAGDNIKRQQSAYDAFLDAKLQAEDDYLKKTNKLYSAALAFQEALRDAFANKEDASKKAEADKVSGEIEKEKSETLSALQAGSISFDDYQKKQTEAARKQAEAQKKIEEDKVTFIQRLNQGLSKFFEDQFKDNITKAEEGFKKYVDIAATTASTEVELSQVKSDQQNALDADDQKTYELLTKRRADLETQQAQQTKAANATLEKSVGNLGIAVGGVFAKMLVDGKNFWKGMTVALIQGVKAMIPAFVVQILGKEFATKGLFGIATAGVLTGLLYGAASALESGLKFARGVIGFRGKGSRTSDENAVSISDGESVITADGTDKNKAELEYANKGGSLRDYFFKMYNPEILKLVQAGVRSMVKDLSPSFIGSNGELHFAPGAQIQMMLPANYNYQMQQQADSTRTLASKLDAVTHELVQIKNGQSEVAQKFASQTAVDLKIKADHGTVIEEINRSARIESLRI